MFLQKFFLCLDVVGRTLVYLCQFTVINLSMDDGILFSLDNGTADTAHDVVRTVLCCNQGIEGSPFSLDGMLQAAVYAVQLLFEGVDFFQ